MLENYSFDAVLMWEWADKYPILYTLIEVTPNALYLMIALMLFKIGSALKSSKKK